MNGKRYTVACLSGHGIGPEVMAEACRAMHAASRLHGFEVDDEHVAFGAEATMRFGHPFPQSSRGAVLGSDAVLVAREGRATLAALAAELDLRASISRLRFREGTELSLLAPLTDDAWRWTLDRAFTLACASRARVTLVGVDSRWEDVAEEVAARNDGVEVERVGLREAVQAFVVAPYRLDVVVLPPEHAVATAEFAAGLSDDRVGAWGRLAGSGPGVFGADHGSAHDIAGQGVADPSSMLLAAALMLGEGLGERNAAATLSDAVGHGTSARPSTRDLADVVLAHLPLSLANSEFYREATA
jgi:3-isopropylmalate dehydrogenase